MPDETEKLEDKVERVEKEIERLKEVSADESKYAPIGSRICATIIDFVLIFAISLVIGIVILLLTAPLNSVFMTISFGIVMLLLTSFPFFPFVFFLYFITLEGRLGKGQTFGKRFLHIKVIKDNGEIPSYFSSFIRTFTRFVDFSVLCHFIGLIVACVTERKQRVGDMLAHTLVVNENVEQPPKSKAKINTTIVVALLVIIFVGAILAVLIAGIALWQLGIFNMGTTSGKGYNGFGMIKPTEWTMNDVVFLSAAGYETSNVQITQCIDMIGGSSTITGSCSPSSVSRGDTTNCDITCAQCHNGRFKYSITVRVNSVYSSRYWTDKGQIFGPC